MSRPIANAGNETQEGAVEVWIATDDQDNAVLAICLMANDPRVIAVDELLHAIPYKNVLRKRVLAGNLPTFIARRLGPEGEIDESQIVIAPCPVCRGKGRVPAERGSSKCKNCRGLGRILKLKTPDGLPVLFDKSGERPASERKE